MSHPLDFTASEPLTLGVELELQLIDRRDGNLTRAASDLLHIIEKQRLDLDIKLEITESMIEVATHIHTTHSGVLGELRTLVKVLGDAADRLNVGVCGGGAHPFQHWHERQIADKPRFHHVAGLYGYLAKQFTVFGQHVHIGCPDGDKAMHLLHGLSRYVPQFIALAASSPYLQGIDTSFDCSRMNTVSSFPLSGCAPYVKSWAEFVEYFDHLQSFGIVESMKDFYWDIRPKPEFGTVEIRVFDTPLTVERAAALAFYAQAIARMLIQTPLLNPEDMYLLYKYNRFQACRFGLEGNFIDASSRKTISIADDVRNTLRILRDQVDLTSAGDAIEHIAQVIEQGNHASAMRRTFSRTHSLDALVAEQQRMFLGQ